MAVSMSVLSLLNSCRSGRYDGRKSPQKPLLNQFENPQPRARRTLKNKRVDSKKILLVIAKQYNSESILTADIAPGTNTLSTFALDK